MFLQCFALLGMFFLGSILLNLWLLYFTKHLVICLGSICKICAVAVGALPVPQFHLHRMWGHSQGHRQTQGTHKQGARNIEQKQWVKADAS